jgi:hypothetical protein
VRKYRKWSCGSSRRVRETGRQLLAALDRKSVLESLQEGLHNLAVEIGRVVAAGLVDDEGARLCGERYVHNMAAKSAVLTEALT